MQTGGIQIVSVRIQHIDVAILVQIGELNPARPVRRPRRSEDLLHAKRALASVQVGYDRFVLLSDQDNEVEMPVVAPEDGVVKTIHVKEGQTVESDMVLVELE